MVQRVIFLKNDKANLSVRETARQRWVGRAKATEREGGGVGGAKATQINEGEGLRLYRGREGGPKAKQSNEWEELRSQRGGGRS